MHTFKIRYQASLSIKAESQKDALERFSTLPAGHKAKDLYNITVNTILDTRYAGQIESNEFLALCYKGILIFHVYQNYDSGPEFWGVKRNWFSWTEQEIDEERNLGSQFKITSELAPEYYVPAPREYVSDALESDDATIKELCWLIDEELAKPETHQRSRQPYASLDT